MKKDNKLIIQFIVFVLVLFLAMIGESLIDWILSLIW